MNRLSINTMLSWVAPVQIGQEWIRAASIFAIFVLVDVIINALWKRVVDRLTAKSSSYLDDLVSSALKGLVTWGLVFAGGYYATLEMATSNKDTMVWTMIGKGFTIGWIFLAITTAMKLSMVISTWANGHTPKGGSGYRDVATRSTFIRKVFNAVVLLFGAIYILSVAGVDISPIIAGGALSGIVIGIALQDTLSNIFAGFFLNFDRPIKIGDYIRVEGNQEGYVEEVGWRYSRVRLIGNNMLIIPNNKLSQSIITNYSLPSHTLSISVPCTVSYDNDLEKVEEVATKVANELQRTLDGDNEMTSSPKVRFKEFSATSISMITVLRSKDIGMQNRLQHQFIKALHRAFKGEGINFP